MGEKLLLALACRSPLQVSWDAAAGKQASARGASKQGSKQTHRLAGLLKSNRAPTLPAAVQQAVDWP